MLHLVIDFQAVLSQATCKGVQGPDGQAFWIDLIGHLSGNFAGLRIPSKLIQQLGRRLLSLAGLATRRPPRRRPTLEIEGPSAAEDVA